MLTDKTVLVTGGTGSFGHAFVPMTLAKYNPRKLIIYSRDEMKQWEMAKRFAGESSLRFFIGDVRDRDRLYRALAGSTTWSTRPRRRSSRPPSTTRSSA
jgi:UDP-N-acetylglucosamine 4,6-dehydratase